MSAVPRSTPRPRCASSRRSPPAQPRRPSLMERAGAPRPSSRAASAAIRRRPCWSSPVRATTAATRSKSPRTSSAGTSASASSSPASATSSRRTRWRRSASGKRPAEHCSAKFPKDLRFDLAIDGLFGIGSTRPLAGAHAALVGKLNALGVPILSLDIPSGINADTGAVMGRAVRASHTITFIAHKPGLLTLDGPDHCGELQARYPRHRSGEPCSSRKETCSTSRYSPRAIRPRPEKFPQGAGGQRRHAGRRRGNGRRRGDRRARRAASAAPGASTSDCSPRARPAWTTRSRS